MKRGTKSQEGEMEEKGMEERFRGKNGLKERKREIDKRKTKKWLEW